jgi:cyclic lactone autoinducer peptide
MPKRRLTQAVLSVGVAGGLLLGTAAAASACDLCWDEPDEPPARGEGAGGLCSAPSQTGGGVFVP